jgi:hypothetical protein
MVLKDTDDWELSARGSLEAGDARAARALLEQVCATRPKEIKPWMMLAGACRMQGDHLSALNALERALAVDPYYFVALLSKGAALEELGQPHAAADAYRAALAMAPRAGLTPALQASLHKAERAIERDVERYFDFLREAVESERARHAGADLARFDECLAVLSGRTKRYVHEPSMLYFPGLPALPFYDNALFPWLPRLEQGTTMIRDELLVVMKEDWGAFHPYIQYPAGAPLRQWQELNHSPAWTSYDLWRDGKKFDDNCRRCPGTTALLESLPLAVQQGYGPTAMFSVLAPHAHIPPHTGATNTRLIVHLPLILPAHCRYRVGNDHRVWREGKAWVFDDSIEHEAWNDSDQARVILIFDVWNPLLTDAERELVTAMMAARLKFR